MIKLILVDIHNIRNGPTTFDLSIFAAPKYLQFIRKKHKVSVSVCVYFLLKFLRQFWLGKYSSSSSLK